ncbi:hypothetical protein BDZ85DRAFT_66640 [Elsinoe ampelina]|uniref:Yeast cell wall synthesis Kre9/Knh1-like N-terminal domain-containing protein n=1 Tax=Elsinoe ampelina TaxID=302913 RepID=A0A6A6GI79_9PEZI|nr:hypothetical protein BDZ85DRAFT_66640 [Elsinoe ampelina]
MRFLHFLSVSAIALASFAAAQSAVLGFSEVPTSVRAGQPATIRYTAEDLSEPVTITLRKGDANDLETIQTLTSDATGGNYTWIPANSFENADDYALQIQQGREINYSGAIRLSGADAAAVSAAQAASASLSSVGAAITSSFAQQSSISSIQSVIASYNSSLQNLTAPVTRPANTNAQPSGTGSTGIPRNQTLVTPTLTSTQINTASGSAGSGQGSSTGAAPAASSSGAAAHAIDAVSKSSPLALVFAVVVGLFL